MHQLVSLLGMAVLLGICWTASNNRKAIPWRVVGWGLGLQLLFALLILKTPPGYAVFRWISGAFTRLIQFTDDGGERVWGWIYKKDGPPIFMIDILMTIVFFAALISALYHLGLMQRVIAGIAWAMRKTMGTSGSETLCASANIFVGQTEAPLAAKPYLETMTMSELHAVMTAGFATVAGGVLMAYMQFGVDPGHLIAASFMSAPAALVTAKMFYPETQTSPTAGDVTIQVEKTTANIFDAICVGAAEGMKLVLNVVAMLLAFISIIFMINWGIGEVHRLFEPGVENPITLQTLLGWLLAPIAWLMGVPWEDCGEIGGLLGIRMILNEFISYEELMKSDVSPRAYVLATYAFCGFANLGSIAIQIGGISTVAPGRRKDLARLGLRAMLAATVASFLTACLAGMLLTEEQVDRDYFRNKARVAETHGKRVEWCDRFLERHPESSYADEFRALKSERP